MKKYSYLLLLLSLSFTCLLSACTKSSQDKASEKKTESASEIPPEFLEEDTMTEYETTFDPNDTSVTEVYEDDEILDAEGQTSVELEIPKE